MRSYSDRIIFFAVKPVRKCRWCLLSSLAVFEHSFKWIPIHFSEKPVVLVKAYIVQKVEQLKR